MRGVLTALLGLSWVGCMDQGNTQPVSTTASANATSAGVPPNAAPTSSAARQPTRVELLALTLTSAVHDKNPVDRLRDTHPGERVYAHIRVRNRTGRTHDVTINFMVNGEPRSTVSLAVEPSWSWRTWAYNTVLPTDRPGTLAVTVSGEEGELATADLPIVTTKR